MGSGIRALVVRGALDPRPIAVVSRQPAPFPVRTAVAEAISRLAASRGSSKPAAALLQDVGAAGTEARELAGVDSATSVVRGTGTGVGARGED